jgi:hypothetical protein
MYTNIPILETKNILENSLKNNLVNSKEAQEIWSWYNTIIQQNYFIFSNTVYTQTDRLDMGAPSSRIISELFLQYTECNFLAPILNKHYISGYYRYEENILILYDSSITHIQSILCDFNNIHSNIQFTSEIEFENNINYLDISIHRTDSDLKFYIYRKPAFTDTIIPYTHAAVRYLHNQLHTHDLDENANSKQLNTIHNILHNNIQGGSNMTRTNCDLFTHKSVPVIFERPCISLTNLQLCPKEHEH